MRTDRLGLALDGLMVASFVAALARAAPWLLLLGIGPLAAMLALPKPRTGPASDRSNGLVVVSILAGAGLLATLTLSFEGPWIPTGAVPVGRGALGLFVLVAAIAGPVGLVWTLLWRSVLLRFAPWKLPAYGVCLLVFLLAPALAIAADGIGLAVPDPWPVAGILLVLSLGVAAALPFADSILRPSPVRKRD